MRSPSIMVTTFVLARGNPAESRHPLSIRKGYLSDALPICTLISEQDCRYFNKASVMVRNKNDAVPANAFPVPPLPLAASEGDDIPPKRIIAHLPESLTDEGLLIRWEPSKLSCGVSCEPDGPRHVLILRV